MQEGNDLEAQEILLHVQYATIFHSMKHTLTLQLGLLGRFSARDRASHRADEIPIVAASMRLQDQPNIMNTARNLARMYQFKMEPFWLLQAALGSGIRAMDSFGNLNLQKFLIREIRVWDFVANGGDCYWNDKIARWIVSRKHRFFIAPRRKGDKDGSSDKVINKEIHKQTEEQALEGLQLESDEDDNDIDHENEDEDDLEDDPDLETGEGPASQQDTRAREPMRHSPWAKPTEREPAFWLMYGQALLTAKSYQSSICMCLPPF